MISLLPDSTLFIQWIIFMVVLIVLNFTVFRPTLIILKERKKRTQGEKARAEVFDQESGDLIAQYEEKMMRARVQGNQERDRLLQEGDAVYSKIVKEARATEAAQFEDIRQDLAVKQKQAAAELQKTAQTIAQDLAQSILERNI